MKKIAILTILSTFLAAGTMAQNPQRVRKPQRVQNQGVSTWTQEQCESMLKSLEEKEKAIRSNPDELKTAEETGWFENARKTRKELLARIEELNK